MKNFILALFLTLSTNTAFSQMYWGNIDGKDTAVNLTKRLGYDADLKSIEVGTADPKSVAQNAGQGSLYLNATKLFMKQDTGSSVNWLAYVLGPVADPASNLVPRWDGSGNLKTSLLSITDAGVATGLTQVDVNNLRLTGNTLSSTSGLINISPTTSVNFPTLTASKPLKIDASKNLISQAIDLTTDVSATLPIANGGTNSGTALNNNRVMQSSTGRIVEAAAITASRALVSDANGIPTHATTTATEIGFVNGVTSAIQTQLNGKEPTLTKGNLTSGTASLSITGGTGAIIGSGTVLSVSTATTAVTGLLTSTDWNTFNNKQAAGNYVTALTGDVTATGPGSVAATIANLAVTNGKIANSTIDLTTKVTGLLPLANGGTNKLITASNGSIPWIDADSFESLAAGTSGNLLISGGAGAPTWYSASSTQVQYGTGSGLANEAAFSYTAASDLLAVNGIQMDGVNREFESNTADVNLKGVTDVNLTAGSTAYVKNGSDIKKKIGSNNPELNILQKYPSFEESILEPTYASSTATQINSTEGFGLKSAQFVTTASATGTMTMDTANSVSTAQQAVVKVGIKTSSSGVQLITRSDGVDISTQNVPSDGKFYNYEIPVVCGTTSCGYKILGDNDAAVETAEVAYAYVAMGEVKNASSVVGPWQAYTPTFTGFGTAASIEVYWRQVGSSIEMRGRFQSGTTTATEARLSLPNSYLTDTTSTIPSIQAAGSWFKGTSSTTHGGAVLIEASLGYITFGPSETFSGGTGSSLSKVNGDSMVASSTTISFTASIPIANLAGSVSTYSQAAQNWFVDVNIGGANPTTSASSTYVMWENSGLDMVLNTGSDTSVQIPCSSTNVATGLTCSVGSEQVGATFTNPEPGYYEACAYATLQLGASGTTTITQWVETADSNVGIVQEGKSRIGGVNNTTNQIAGSVSNCGTFYFSDVKKRALRFAYESDASNYLVMDRSTSYGQRDARITVRKISKDLITGSFKEVVTTPGVASPKIFSAKVGSTGTVSNEIGDWINGNCANGSTGNYTCTYNTGIFTSTPNCQVTIDLSTGNGFLSRVESGASTVGIEVLNTSLAYQNEATVLSCHGY